MHSIKETLKIFTGYPGQLSRILGFVNSIDATLGDIQSALRESRNQKPFVLVLINGFRVEEKETDGPKVDTDPYLKYQGARVDTITDKPVTMAVSGYAPRVFNFQPDVKVANLQVGIICDVQRVRVDQIVVANQHLSPTIEGGPFSYAPGIIGPWNRITIVTSLR